MLQMYLYINVIKKLFLLFDSYDLANHWTNWFLDFREVSNRARVGFRPFFFKLSFYDSSNPLFPSSLKYWVLNGIHQCLNVNIHYYVAITNTILICYRTYQCFRTFFYTPGAITKSPLYMPNFSGRDVFVVFDARLS